MSESEQGTSPTGGLCFHLDGLTQAVKDLQLQYSDLKGQVQELSMLAALGASEPSGHTIVLAPSEPEVPLPERFAGDGLKFQTFQSSCELYISLQPRTFAQESTRVGLVISLLAGAPQIWAHRLLQLKSPMTSSLEQFFQAMAVLYDDPHQTATVEKALRALRQGRCPAEDYTSEFHYTAWNDAALSNQFHFGLTEELKDELARTGVPQSLEALINLAVQLGT